MQDETLRKGLGGPGHYGLDGLLCSPNASPTLKLHLELYCGVSKGRDEGRTAEWEQEP